MGFFRQDFTLGECGPEHALDTVHLMDPLLETHEKESRAMNRNADSFLRLGLLMLKEARQQLLANRNACHDVEQLIDELQALANKLNAPHAEYAIA